MSRAAISMAALVVGGALSPAAAGSWHLGVGVGIGGPAYYGPPPVYYAAPPAYVYEQPPVVYAPPPPPPVVSSISPDEIFDTLEEGGYSGFGPMAFREGVYKLSATNRRGDLVALEVSAIDGAVEREYLIRGGHRVQRAAPIAPRAAPPPVRQAPNASGSDPLVVY